MQGLKCDKLLWHQYHSEITPTYSAKNESNLQRVNIQNEFIFKYAKLIYPNGKEVPRNHSMSSSHKMTQNLIAERSIVYNASFLTSDFFSRTNILIPSSIDDSWEIIEVKSSINLKHDNILDICFQVHVARQSGLKISNCSILHVNPDYSFTGELDISQLFILKNVTDRVNSAKSQFEKQVNYLKSLITRLDSPDLSKEHSCGTPKNCILKTCWNDLGEGNLFNLREGGDLTTKFFNLGVRYVKDIPEDPDLTFTQKVQIESERSNSPFLQKDKLTEFLNSIQFPIYFLDFETINPAIPVYVNSKPFQHIPFLYSLHVMDNKDLPPNHFSYIDDGSVDPREKILDDLSKIISIDGTILCYNAVFEMKCLRESVKLFPQYSDWYSSIANRFVDLSNPFRFFYYYHPKQNGSASLKSVLPALTGLDYKELEINDGNLANLEFLRAKTMNLPEEELTSIYRLLLDYCKMDTYAMVQILNTLWKLI
ncbi:MAG TPA: DUF2779 domain-containing protein [Leptospiraceae bacterium]|nr:DUF2779 domain-containing protein [Leptospiraceae bacterium]HMX32030.1 DUF2779 domain-containing protein [Leptospiraceae bacterium]HMY31207.1 DUF2779 domain-containing protein [Leptospiraceae bacterium]HMZ63306.1 DUF2779 domain-containing protein [Leptospiraceae bacterium]HNA06090.1 DUF2779 domain-containing protein [Leptospiraceae bacterium]